MKLGFILLGVISTSMAAESTPNDVLAHLAQKVEHIEAYRPNGIDLRRGFVLDLTADPIGDAICRSQRVFVFYKRAAAEGVDHVEVQNRYHVDDWTIRRDATPLACGDTRENRWTVARDDRTFRSVLPAIGQVYRLTAQAQPTSRYPFKFVCRDYANPCADPAAKLREAFALGVDEVGEDGATIWARRTVYGMAPHWDMKIELKSGAISTVTLDFTPPPLS